MTTRTVALLGSLIGTILSGVVDGRIVQNACIKTTSLFGPSGEKPESGRIDGDMADLGEMSLMSLAYSRPTDILVCADDYKVHGMRVTLKMHPTEETDHSDMGEYQDQIKALNNYIDTKSSVYQPYHMKMVGEYITPCQKMEIADDDKIMYIDMIADSEKLRGLTIQTASGQIQSFGNMSGGWAGEVSHKQDFSDKIDLLGLFGYIMQLPSGDHSEYIYALGFIMNDCPTRDSVDYEANWVMPDKEKHKEMAAERRRGEDKSIAIVILAIIIVILSICALYCCLKNRGQMCNAKDRDSGNVDQEMSIQQEDNSVAQHDKHVPSASVDQNRE